MTPKEIKEYLGTMVEIEKECFTHERLLQALKKRMAPLGYYHKIAEPTYKAENWDWLSLLGHISVIGIIGAVLGFIVAVFIPIPNKSDLIDILGAPFESYALRALTFLFKLVLAGAGLGALIGVILEIVDYKKRVKEKKSTYQSDKRNYQQWIVNDKIRVQKEKKALVYLKYEYETVLQSYNKLKSTRSKLYARNILFEKYRCFTAVSTLYEYFSAGRFTNLEDAYNQLELEARLDRISLQLNVVISQLEQIKETQYVIYSAITESNNRLDTLIQSSGRIESGVKNLQLEGEELNDRISRIQATSDLNLYLNGVNNMELKRLNEWCKGY